MSTWRTRRDRGPPWIPQLAPLFGTCRLHHLDSPKSKCELRNRPAGIFLRLINSRSTPRIEIESTLNSLYYRNIIFEIFEGWMRVDERDLKGCSNFETPGNGGEETNSFRRIIERLRAISRKIISQCTSVPPLRISKASIVRCKKKCRVTVITVQQMNQTTIYREERGGKSNYSC